MSAPLAVSTIFQYKSSNLSTKKTEKNVWPDVGTGGDESLCHRGCCIGFARSQVETAMQAMRVSSDSRRCITVRETRR